MIQEKILFEYTLEPEAKEYRKKEYICRICYDETYDREEVIVPCLCSGSGKYICHECLQDWRANGNTSRSFTHCPTCDFEYHLEKKGEVDEFQKGTICLLPATWFGRRRYFRYLVFSDFFLGFFIINGYLVMTGIFLRWIDSHENLVHLMPWDDVVPHDENEHVIKAFKHHKATYYAASLFTTIFIFVLFVCWKSLSSFCKCRVKMYKMQRSCLTKSRQCNRTKLVVVLLVFIALKAVLGAFFALVSIVAWMQKAASRHMHVLDKKEIANEFQVVDLELAGRLKYKQNLGCEGSVSASEPPKSHHLASSNLLNRLFESKII